MANNTRSSAMNRLKPQALVTSRLESDSPHPTRQKNITMLRNNTADSYIVLHSNEKAENAQPRVRVKVWALSAAVVR